MKNRVRMLKVKVKSLAAEAQIIRLEESRSVPGSVQQNELHNHWVRDVRAEQRSSLLAYAFLRGRPLAACEAKCKVEPDWKRVGQIVEKFGTVEDRKDQAVRFGEWRAARLALAATEKTNA